MFKKELTPEKVNKIISNIEKGLEAANKSKKLTLADVVHVVMEQWTSEISFIVTERKKNKV